MKEEALKLADELEGYYWESEDEELTPSKLIRMLVAENEFLKDWRDTWSPFIKQCVANNDMTQECVAKTKE